MAAQGLKDYLQRYVDKPERDGGNAKSSSKKKKKRNAGTGAGGNAGPGVIIVDDQAAWQKELRAEEEDDEPDDEGEGPTVIEDVEVKRMQRMEALKTHRPYLSMANDGSGWVTVKDDEGGLEAAAGHERENSADRSPQGKFPDLAAKRSRHDSPDLSPPRRRKGSPDTASGRTVASEDFPLPRKPKSFTSGDLSSPRRRREGSPDLSSPRRRHDSPLLDESRVFTGKRKRMASPDSSPPRRNRGTPDVPAGRKGAYHEPDPRRVSKFSSAGPNPESTDSSPPRRRRDSPGLSPPRRRHYSQHGESRDMSTKRKGNSSQDLSPPRRGKGSADLSPPRRTKLVTGDSRPAYQDKQAARRRHDSPDDLSPARSRLPAAAARNRNEVQDLSPPRRRRDFSDQVPARNSGSKDVSSPRMGDFPDQVPVKNSGSKDLSPPRKPKSIMASEHSSPPRKKGSGRMADGAFAGLKSDREVVSEGERKRAAEAKMLSQLDPSLSGRGAETVFRDKRGRRLEGLEEMLRQQRGEAKPVEQPLEWGKGLAQKKVADANVAELEAERSKPFARYRDDAELDKSLKERLRWGDPMAHLVKQKTAEPVLEDLGAREEMKASGFIVPQDIPKHSWLKRGTAPPPNRYDIRPGRHWDGVDRSTGFEQGLFKQKNEKKARDLEAYLWSVSDM